MNNFQVFMICATVIAVAGIFAMAVVVSEAMGCSGGCDPVNDDEDIDPVVFHPGGWSRFLVCTSLGWDEYDQLQEDSQDRPFTNQLRVVFNARGQVVHTEIIA